MTTALSPSLIDQLRQGAIDTAHLLPLLVNHKLVPQLLSEQIIDQAIAAFDCIPEETHQACQAFYQQWELTLEEQQSEWQSHHCLTQTQLEQLTTRNLRLEKFITATWGHKLESYFLQHKHKLDQVIYSLICHGDRELLTELPRS
jgi:hypothetical protein